MVLEGTFELEVKPVRDILTAEVATVSPDTTIKNAAGMMRKRQISCVVVTEAGRPLGIYTERDLVKTAHKSLLLNGDKISSVMSKPLITVKEETGVAEAYLLMVQKGIRHIIVTDGRERLKGIITQSNIMNSLEPGYFLEAKDVLRYMCKAVITIDRQGTVEEALSLMANNSISCLVVVDGNTPVGVFTGRDVVRLLDKGGSLLEVQMEEVMSFPPVSVGLGTSLFEAAGIMRSRRIRRVVVVDEKGGIAGLITQSDVVRVLEGRYSESLNRVLSKIKNDILSNISHEFRTPLTVMKSSLQLAHDTGAEETKERYIEAALRAVERLNDLVDNLLFTSNIKRGTLRPEHEELDLRVLIPAIVSDILKEYEDKVVIETVFSEGVPLVKGNQLALRKAIENILENAVKFRKEDGGEVRISIENEGNYVRLRIRDSGIGIPRDKLEQVFDPFYQVDPSSTRRYDGIGMGLAVAKLIVESHGGQAWAEKVEGEGTTVNVTLPASRTNCLISKIVPAQGSQPG